MLYEERKKLFQEWFEGKTIQIATKDTDEWRDATSEEIVGLRVCNYYLLNRNKFRLKPTKPYVVPIYYVAYVEVEAEDDYHATQLAEEKTLRISVYSEGKEVDFEYDSTGEPSEN